MSEKQITQRIKAIREQAGLTMDEAAAALGYKTTSGYQHYEDPAKFRQEYLPPKLATKFIKAFVGRGRPGESPVTVDQILELTQPIGGGGSDEDRLARVWWSLAPEDRRVVVAMAESLLHRERVRKPDIVTSEGLMVEVKAQPKPHGKSPRSHAGIFISYSRFENAELADQLAYEIEELIAERIEERRSSQSPRGGGGVGRMQKS